MQARERRNSVFPFSAWAGIKSRYMLAKTIKLRKGCYSHLNSYKKLRHEHATCDRVITMIM